MISDDIIKQFRVPLETKVRLKDYDTGWRQSNETKELCKDELKVEAQAILDRGREELARAQDLLAADNRYAILVVLQGMDAAGKDGTIKHVMSGLNPQGCEVHSFKAPSPDELDHDFLWRYSYRLPARGRIGIFNRSHYEEVLVVRVHPKLLDRQKIPPGKRGKGFWKQRYEDINAFEQQLVRNGTLILKFFLHLSKAEQKKRFLQRLERPDKTWKFSAADIAERAFWDDYVDAYEAALSATSTKCAPWYIVPADHKWATRAVVASVLTSSIRALDLNYPDLTEERRRELAEAKARLEAE